MKAINLKSIRINRMPGIQGISLQGLDSGLNVILGKNAVGKSTLAKSACIALFPDFGIDGASIDCIVQLDNDELMLQTDTGRRFCTRLGIEYPYPVSGSASAWAYLMSLPELLRSEDKPVAQEVFRQVMGGLDIPQAAKRLGYASEPTKAFSLKRDVQAAEKAITETTRSQRRVESEEKQLVDLRSKLKAAKSAADMVPVIECALDLRNANERLVLARAELSGFDQRISLLKGDELDSLKSIENSQTALQKQIYEAEMLLAETEALLEANESPVDADIDAAESCLEQLGNAQTALERIETEITGLTARVHSADFMLDGNGSHLEELDSNNLTNILETSRKAARLRSRLESLQELCEWIGPETDPEDTTRLTQGIGYLHSLLRQPDSIKPSWHAYALIFLGIAFGFGISNIFAGNIAWGLICLGSIIAAIFIIRSKPVNHSKDIIRQEYERLNLRSPQDWSTTEVADLADELVRQHSHIQTENAKSERWAGCHAKLAETETEYAQVLQQLNEYLIDAGMHWTGSEADVILVVDAIIQKRNDNFKISGFQAQAARYKTIIQDELQKLSVILHAEPDNYLNARKMLEHLNADIIRYKANMQRASEQRKNLEQLRTNLETTKAEKISLYSRCQVDNGDIATLENLVRFRPHYENINTKLMEANSIASSLDKTLQDRLKKLANDIPIPDYINMSLGDLESILTETRSNAQKLESILISIRDIENHISNIKERHDLESAVANRNMKRDQLRAKRHEALESAIGWILTDYIKRPQRSHPQALLSKAAQRFADYTGGDFSLEFDVDNQRIAARRTSDGLGLSLDQLSSGTRVQLLMAARMAYIESQEYDIIYPLMLDESLATSDDDRAAKIIKSIIGITETGRQVLYFTAQPDEVDKWQETCSRLKIPINRIELS